MRYYYLVKCKNCGKSYEIESTKGAFDTMKKAEERNQTISSSSFIHNCDGHVYGVGEITGIEFREEPKCNNCGGTGSIDNIIENSKTECPACQGTGIPLLPKPVLTKNLKSEMLIHPSQR